VGVQSAAAEAGVETQPMDVLPTLHKTKKNELKKNTLVLMAVTDLEVCDNDALRANITEIAVVMLGPNHERLPGPPFVSLVKPPDDAIYNKLCTAITGHTKAKLIGAPTSRTVMLELVSYIAAAAVAYKAAHPEEEKEIVVCIAGHNVAACDLDHIWNAMNRESIPIPTLWDSYWCTLHAVQVSTHPLCDKKWTKSHQGSPLTGHSVSALIAKMCVLQPSRQPQLSALMANAHSALHDVEMNIAFIAEPKFWSLRNLVGAGMRPLADVWQRKQETFDTRYFTLFGFFLSSLDNEHSTDPCLFHGQPAPMSSQRSPRTRK
jgi:hypothetical protein